jgi:hypothetical protein
VIDQDSSHGFGSSGKEVAATVPTDLALTQQTHVSFVNQRGRLERVLRALLGHFRARETTKLLVNNGQKLVGGVRIAFVDGLQETRDGSRQ